MPMGVSTIAKTPMSQSSQARSKGSVELDKSEACAGLIPQYSGVGLSWPKVAVIVLMALLAANATVLLGKHTARWDASDYFCPYYMLVADYARHGQLLTWTPLVNGGCPAGVEPQVGALSPVMVGFGLLTGGSELGFRLYWLALWLLGGWGVLVLARHLDSPPWAGCVGALGYLFCAVYTGHAEHTSYLLVMSWFPWAIWRLDVALVERRIRPAVEAGALWGLSTLGGYPGMIFAGGIYAALWAIGRVLLTPEPVEGATPSSGPGHVAVAARRGLVAIAMTVVFGAVGLTVALPQYVGFVVESRGYSDRAWPLSREVVLRDGALTPAMLSTLASPYLCLHVRASQSPLWESDVAMSSLYLAPTVLVLALAAGRFRDDRFRMYLWAIAAIYLAVALGDWLPLRGWLYDWAPPSRYFRYPAMFRCYTLFTLVVVGLLSARDFQKNLAGEQSWRRWTVVIGTLAVSAAVVFALVCRMSPAKDSLGWIVLGGTHLAIVWGGLLWIARCGRRADQDQRQRLLTRHLIVVALIDAVLTTVISKPTVYSDRKGWQELDAHRVASVDLTAQGLNRLANPKALSDTTVNGHLPLKIPVLQCYTPFRNHFHDQLASDPVLGELGLGADRTWFSPKIARVPWNDRSLDRLIAWSERHGRACLTVTEPEAVRAATSASSETDGDLETLPPVESIATKTIEYQSNRLVLDVEAPAPGWVLVTDRWAPGWQASVNGCPQQVWLGNLVYRAVEVEAGHNRIEFAYRPFGYPWLLGISWGVLAVSLVGACWSRRIASRT